MDTSDRLKALESELLATATRKNADRVAALLTDDFREFGASGRVYSKQDIVRALEDEIPVLITPHDLVVSFLSETVALVTYRSRKEQPGHPPADALRSSVWQQVGGAWRMVFHQGTALPSSGQNRS